MTDNSEQQTSTTPTKPKKGFFGYAWRTILWFLVILYFALGAAWLGARYCLAPYLNEQDFSGPGYSCPVRLSGH